VQFRILGPLEVVSNGRTTSLGPAKERALLGTLLLHANRVVSVERLVDSLWGENPPPSAPKVVQVYVSQLRKRLDDPERLVTKAPGYLLSADESDLDAATFERLLEQARACADTGEHAAAVEQFDAALALWRGPVLADVTFESLVRGEVDRLEDLRLAAIAERTDCQLALGRHERVIAELEPLVAAHPLRERFRAQLMLALYRAGRQAEALAVYQEGRRLLVEELGIEPGPELRELERSILRQEPALDSPFPARPESRRTARRGRAALAAIPVAALLVVAAVALRPSGTGISLEPRSLGRIDARTNEVVGEVPLGFRPRAIAADSRMVWVAGAEGTLIRVDPERLRVLRTLSLGARPSDVDFGRGALWVGDATGEAVVRVDVAHDAVSARVKLPPASARAALLGPVAPSLAFGAGSLWISRGQESVVRIEPRSYRIRAEIRPPRGASSALAFGEGALWVGGWNAVSRISPATNRVTSTIRLGAMPVALAAGAGAVWAVLPAAGKVVRIDAESESVETIPVSGAPTAVAVGREAVWVAVPSRGEVLHIDPGSGEVVARIQTGATPTAVAAAGDDVWVTVT
jgi:DNA-binding SARP family transcriptional activator/DNA-binding beta-propeller fold protein YncE